MVDRSELQLNAHEFIETRRRHCLFNGRAKKNDDGSWRVHIFADYVPSIDITSTTDPIGDMASHYADWKKAITSKNERVIPTAEPSEHNN